MSGSPGRRDRAAVVAVLLATVAWFVATRPSVDPGDFFRMDFCRHDYALEPQKVPGSGAPVPFSVEAAFRESGVPVHVLLDLGILLVGAFLVVGIRALRRRRPPTRRTRALPARIGVLAALLGVAASALAKVNDDVVLERLWPVGLWFDTDSLTRPWGPLTLLVVGTGVGLLGVALSGALGLLFPRGRPHRTGGDSP